MNNDITDFETYNRRMSRSCMDKLFWVDKISFTPGDVIIDFGCADGTLIKEADHWFEGAILIGYDIDPTMIEKIEFKSTRNTIHFTSDWVEVLKLLVAHQTNATVILSSLIHEVYHYGTPQDINLFWERVFGDKLFNTVVIRDMIPSFSINRPSAMQDVANVMKNESNMGVLNDFEKHWGSIRDNKALIHYLLKYKYVTPNWQREVQENYLPLHMEDLFALIPKWMEIIYCNHYVLPYLYRQVKKDFGIQIRDNTHLQMILEMT